jgi:hypothetical protein
VTLPLYGAMKYYSIASTLVTTIQDLLTSDVDRACVVPGTIPWDACDCGMLAVSVGSVYLTNDFPEPEGLPYGNCPPVMEGTEIVIQIIRCAPSPSAGASSTIYPSEGAQQTAAQILASDAYAVLSGTTNLMCQLKGDDAIWDYVVGPVSPQGPEGGCVGVELRVAVAMPRG